MITWKLRKGVTYRKGHPWTFARDLEIEAGRAEPGYFVRIVSDKNEVLAFGYGNPHCSLAFRSLPLLGHPRLAAMASVGPGSSDFQDWVVAQIATAWQRRLSGGFQGSYRVVFSEADGLPGLILDRYELADAEGGPAGQVLAAQILTAGFERIWGSGLTLMERVVRENAQVDWDHTIVVERKDAGIRKIEGLKIQAPRVLHRGSHVGSFKTDVELKHALVRVSSQSAKDTAFLVLQADLLEGQKTGFFLDQSYNMQIVLQALEAQAPRGELRVLDLCSYVGHWSLQLGHFAKLRGIPFSAALVDVSGEALLRAQHNLQRAGINSTTHELDVLKDSRDWPQGPYDVVIADPPAFVKARKDLPQGLHAYLKLNTEAVKAVKPGGLLVSCSCSGAVSEQDLVNAVSKALPRAGRHGQILARGQQGWDHPWSMNFPEGRYLKMILTRIDGRSDEPTP